MPQIITYFNQSMLIRFPFVPIVLYILRVLCVPVFLLKHKEHKEYPIRVSRN